MTDVGGVAADRLRSLIERIERLEEEKRGLAADIKDIYAEAKSAGFDTKTMRKIIAERKMEEHDRQEQEQLLDLYRQALGMLGGTPLGEAAIQRGTKTPKAGKKPAASTKPAAPPPDTEPFAPAPDEVLDATAAPPDTTTVEDAAKAGQAAAAAGQPITANPYKGGDPRRSAWDEAWCHELGSDGMDLPDDLRIGDGGGPGDGSPGQDDVAPAGAAA